MSDPKLNAARGALDFVKPGMKLGLGTGSTAAHFVRLLGERVKAGLDVVGVPTSEATRLLALEVGVPLLEVDAVTALDLCVDGADEIDGAFRMIKGGGGALLREKIIASASAHVICIADESKRVETLGKFPLPVEVTPFGYTLTATKIGAALRSAGCAGDRVVLRQHSSGGAFVTDGGNYVLDAHAERIPDADALADALSRIVGVVEHGLFIGLARTAVLGTDTGAQVIAR